MGMLGSIGYYQSRASLKAELSRSLEHKTRLLVSSAGNALMGGDIDHSGLTEIASRIESRITIITKDGSVIADSHNAPKDMDNHGSRPEVISAKNTGKGLTLRFSKTMQETMYFMVLPVRHKTELIGYIRVSSPSRHMDLELREISQAIISIALLGLIAVMLLGVVLARNVADPVVELTQICKEMMAGNYQRKAIGLPPDEIGELGATLNKLGDEITRRIDTITNDRIQLRKLERIRTDFVANVSHEIKTPLTAIKGYAETLLAEDLIDPKISRRFIQKINLNASRLSNLVQDILSLARLESPDQFLKLEKVSWKPLLTQIIHRYEDEISDKNLKLQVITAQDGDTFVVGDREAMIQVLENLVSNAIRYTPKGGTLKLSTKSDGKREVLHVEDTGIGIAREDLDRIFERFYRVDKARSRQLGSTGLGLSIVKHMVAGMNGKLSVQSEFGKGSCFSVELNTATITGA